MLLIGVAKLLKNSLDKTNVNGWYIKTVGFGYCRWTNIQMKNLMFTANKFILHINYLF